MSARRVVLRTVVVAIVLLALMAGCAAWKLQHVSTLPPQPALPVAAGQWLTGKIGDELPNAALVRRGQYLARVGDCLSCHLAPDGQPFAGGAGLNTPFGVIYSANITSDSKTGIGAWTSDQFYRAMHDGIGANGERLYPAFPYPWFTRASREDDDALLAFLKTVPAVDATPPPNALPFPLNRRAMIAAWDALFLDRSPLAPDTQQSMQRNRGAAIVNGLGHCGACHTPKNLLGAEKHGVAFEGALLDNYVAPDLTENQRTGLAGWSIEEIAEYLRTGRNAHADAGGRMADVVTYSTALMTDEDRHAIAVYLKSLAPRADATAQVPDAGAMKRGAQVYLDACSACHLADGVGQPGLFPPLGHNALAQQDDPTGLVHIVLGGSRAAPNATFTSALTMPTIAWKLSDQDIADVATYLRNSWGNQASAVSAERVRTLRATLEMQTAHLTDNSEPR